MQGPKTVTALSLLSMDPSPTVAASAQQAARTKHGLVNVTRLVRALERMDQEEDMSWLEVQKTWERFCKPCAIQMNSELATFPLSADSRASTTAATLDDLERILARVEVQVQDSARLPTPPEEAAAEDLLEAHVPTKLEDEPVELEIPVAAPSAAPAVVVTPTASKAFDMADYFARREQESKQGGDAGLLPLKSKVAKDPMDEEGMRQRLLAGANSKGMGARELQEELSGQLAGFSSSLENEKSLLQNSQDVLEQNLDGTLKSKGNLDQVSRKGRSTTCMQLGIMVTVFIIFVWTYMLIRFT
ncbi:hypothetical protein A1Q1_06383 [Trichosporon asahii var. asahii CBS 2479]|uniref:Vesicle transport protein n=1 Tax=Trichosporon asahii var. asahii (strain ATCC 90039 / CBS 2479 / JCM 2466 / KCTC 7840 / NBRC 103889/ NCYC 2677 / UAMH 7654) TaxID=1186058 RepID=J4U5I2_TRIAS|nr:hypothetical protein A1Q1_06383 [Trichosporon asahii var. asahii CBS 2479]EJT45245.1 hypothetical protein A1Q1_06383 [Trichosporon asahii var. asahii CBS 2479]